MGAAYLLALIICCTTAALIVRDLWHVYKRADREWRIARADEQFARTHRIEP